MKRLLYIILIMVLIVATVGFYLYTKKPADTRDEKIDYEISCIELMKEFSIDEEKATKKYSDKVLLITGKINEVNPASITVFLDAGDPLASVTCSFYNDELTQIQKLKTGDDIKVKGKCTGKLIDVVLNNCSLYSSK